MAPRPAQEAATRPPARAEPGIRRPANIPPVAVIWATPPSGSAPLEVVLSASESTDADGQIVSYAWSIEDELDVGVEVTHSLDVGCHAIELS